MARIKKKTYKTNKKLIPIILNQRKQIQPKTTYKKRRLQALVCCPTSDIKNYDQNSPAYSYYSNTCFKENNRKEKEYIFSTNFYPRFRYFMDQEFEDPYCQSLAQLKNYRCKPPSFLILGKLTTEMYHLAKMISLAWNIILIDGTNLFNELMKQFDIEVDYGKISEAIFMDRYKKFLFVNRNVLWDRIVNILQTNDIREKGYVMVGFPFGLEYTTEDVIKQYKTLINIYPPTIVINVMLDDEEYCLAKRHAKTDPNHLCDIDSRLFNACQNLNKPTNFELSKVFVKQNSRQSNIEDSISRAIKFDVQYPESTPIKNQGQKDIQFTEYVSEMKWFLCKKGLRERKLGKKVRNKMLWRKRRNVKKTLFKPVNTNDLPPDFRTVNYIKFYIEDVCALFGINKKLLPPHLKEFEKSWKFYNDFGVLKQSRESATAIDIIMRHNDPQSTIRVDGRLPFKMLFDIIQERLLCISLSKKPSVKSIWSHLILYTPSKVIEVSDDDEEDEDDEGANEFPKDTIPPKDIIIKTCSNPWGQRCPVAYKNSDYLAGQIEFAASYQGDCYVLSSEVALELFQQTPNKYLLPLMPAAACKLILPQSNYTDLPFIADAIATFFGAKLINFTDIEAKALKKKWHNIEKEIEAKVSGKLLKRMNCCIRKYYKKQEHSKLKEVFGWLNLVLNLLHLRLSRYSKTPLSTSNEGDEKPFRTSSSHSFSLIEAKFDPYLFIAKECNASLDFYYRRYVKMSEIIKHQFSEVNFNSVEPLEADITVPKYSTDFFELKERFLSSGLGFFENIASCQDFYRKSIKLLQFLPKEFWPSEPPREICENSPEYIKTFKSIMTEIRSNLHLSSTEIVSILSSIFRHIEKPFRGHSLRYGGWVVYNMPINLNHWLALLQRACPPFDVLEIALSPDKGESDLPLSDWNYAYSTEYNDEDNPTSRLMSEQKLLPEEHEIREEAFLNTVSKVTLREKLLTCYILEKNEPKNQVEFDAIPNFSDYYKDLIDDRYKLDYELIEESEKDWELNSKEEDTGNDNTSSALSLIDSDASSSSSSDTYPSKSSTHQKYYISDLASSKTTSKNTSRNSFNEKESETAVAILNYSAYCSSEGTSQESSPREILTCDTSCSRDSKIGIELESSSDISVIIRPVIDEIEPAREETDLNTLDSKALEFYCKDCEITSGSGSNSEVEEIYCPQGFHLESNNFYAPSAEGYEQEEDPPSSDGYSSDWEQCQDDDEGCLEEYEERYKKEQLGELLEERIEEESDESYYDIPGIDKFDSEVAKILIISKEIWLCRTVDQFLSLEEPKFEGDSYDETESIDNEPYPKPQGQANLTNLFASLEKKDKLHGVHYNHISVYPESKTYRTLYLALNMIEGGYGSIKLLFNEEQYNNEYSNMKKTEGENPFNPRYPFFNSHYLCPVDLRGGISRLGEMHRHYEYMDEDYYFCSHTCQQLFRMHPNKFSRFVTPTDPPILRICFASTPGTGSEQLARKLAEELELDYYDFDDLVTENLLPSGCLPVGMVNEHRIKLFDYIPPGINREDASKRIDELRAYLSCHDSLPDALTKVLLKPFHESKRGFVYHRFPHMINDIEYMTANGYYPDLIISKSLPILSMVNNLADVVRMRWRMKLAVITRNLIDEDVSQRRYWKACSEIYFKKTINQMLTHYEIMQYCKNLHKELDEEIKTGGIPKIQEPDSILTNESVDYLTEYLEENDDESDSLNSLESMYQLAKNLSKELDMEYNTLSVDSIPVSEPVNVPPTECIDVKRQYSETEIEPDISSTSSTDTVHKLMDFMKCREEPVSWPATHSVEERNTIYQYSLGRPYFYTELFERAARHVKTKQPRPHYKAIQRAKYIINERLVRSTLIKGLTREAYIIERLKDEAGRSRIPWQDWDPSYFNDDNLIELMKEFKRTSSHFEKVYDIDVIEAEMLLGQGYFYLSRFGRRCPVQMFEGQKPTHQVLNSNEMKAVVHKKYIYFLGSFEAKEKFMSDPFKYLQQKSLAPLVILNILIIGPPYSGKCSLAEKLNHEYGLEIISCKSAVDYVLTSMPWTNLAKQIKDSLRLYFTISYELITKAIKAATMTKRALTYGWVLIKVPFSNPFLKCLEDCNITPNITLSISGNLDTAMKRLEQNLRNMNLNIEYERDCLHKISKPLLRLRYDEWELKTQQTVLTHNWIKAVWGNLYMLNGEEHMYFIFEHVNEIYLQVYQHFDYYYKNTNRTDTALPIGLLNLNPVQYNLQESNFLSHCPVCKILFDINKKCENAADKFANIFQVDELYYWVCDDHIEDFVSEPKFYTTERGLIHLAQPINEVSDWKPTYNGICPVCLWDPKKLSIIWKTRGESKYAVVYNSKIYFTCNMECRKKFLMEPIKYDIPTDTRLIETWLLAKTTDSILPEFVSSAILRTKCDQWDIVLKAMQKVVKFRPKIPGISVKNSAIVYLAYCLFEMSTGYEFIKPQEAAKLCDEIEDMSTRLQKAFLEAARKALPMVNAIVGGLMTEED